jgi:hypothetical protein
MLTTLIAGTFCRIKDVVSTPDLLPEIEVLVNPLTFSLSASPNTASAGQKYGENLIHTVQKGR